VAGIERPGVLAFIERLAAHTEKGESIARAAELIHLEEEGPTAASVREGKLNWSDVVDRFHHHKVSSGTISERTWRLRYRLHMNEVLQLLSEPKAPKNGNDLLRVLIERYAFRCPPGGDGRSHRFAHVRDLLVFSHQHCGAPERWRPTVAKKEIVGIKPKGSKKRSTALRDIDALRVYEAIPDARWKLAFGLMVTFGLRPPSGRGLPA